MTLYKVEARNAAGTLLAFELADISDGLLLADVDGLDPVKATLVSSGFAQLDGEQFHASRRESRNITMKIVLKPDFVTTTARSLRDRLYDFFMPQSEVFLRFYTVEGPVVDIAGRVETCESILFAKDSVVDISIMCFNPDLIDVDTEELSGSTISTSVETDVVYVGTVQTGFIFTLNVNRILTEFTIYFRFPDGVMRQMDIAAAFVSGDVVTIRTTPGSKSATLTRSGTVTSILYAVSPQSSWPLFKKGTNTIRIYATGAAIPWTINYMNKYGGL